MNMNLGMIERRLDRAVALLEEAASIAKKSGFPEYDDVSVHSFDKIANDIDALKAKIRELS